MILSHEVIKQKAFWKDTVTLDFSENCNLHCLNCPRKTRLKNWNPNNYWKPEEAKSLIDWIMLKIKPRCLDIGVLAEFCIYPYASDVIDYLSKTYGDDETRILITTNLTCLSDKLLNSIANSKSNLVINTSLWSSDKEMYAKLQGQDLFENVDNNLRRLLLNHGKANIMISTIDYNRKQLFEIKSYVRKLSKEYNIKYDEILKGSRNFIDKSLTLFVNAYMPDCNNIPDDYEKKFNDISEVLNTGERVDWKCDMIVRNIYLTYNRCYPCCNSSEYFEFTVKNLDDLQYKIRKQTQLEGKMDICKTCAIGYCCMGKGH